MIWLYCIFWVVVAGCEQTRQHFRAYQVPTSRPNSQIKKNRTRPGKEVIAETQQADGRNKKQTCMHSPFLWQTHFLCV